MTDDTGTGAAALVRQVAALSALVGQLIAQNRAHQTLLGILFTIVLNPEVRAGLAYDAVLKALYKAPAPSGAEENEAEAEINRLSADFIDDFADALIRSFHREKS